MIDDFGTLGAVLAGTRSRQMAASGNDADGVLAVREFRRTMMHALRSKLRQRRILGSLNDVLLYLQADMAHLPFERLRVLYLDTGRQLISDEISADGSTDRAPVDVRKIIGRGIELGATGIILAHNHPSGIAKPSEADTMVTRRVADAGRLFDIAVHDHVIIGTSDHFSMRMWSLI